MGREWYFNWGSKSSKKEGVKSTGRSSGSRSSSNGGGATAKKHALAPSSQVAAATAVAAAASSGGCMNVVLHMFDLHHCLHPNYGSFVVDEPTSSKGVEAPRNSLESNNEEERDNQSLHISQSNMQIKTNRSDAKLKLVHAPRAKVEDVSSESSCSPAAARTPTLVARLMGLDILPESNASTPRSSSSHNSHLPPPTTPSRTRKPGETRAKSSNTNDAPETPRSSSSSSSYCRRKQGDGVVEQHRLSLQIDKENSIVKEIESSRPSCSAISTKRREGRSFEEGNKSPGFYARQIMKQVRETVSRRVGVDITNTITQREVRRDEHLLSKTSSSTTMSLKKLKNKDISPSLSSSSPKLRSSSDHASNTRVSKLAKSEDVVEVVATTVKLQARKPLSKIDEGLKMVKNDQQQCFDNVPEIERKRFGNKNAKLSSKMSTKSYDSIRNMKDEQFVRPTRTYSSGEKKCKKTPLSSELVHGSVPSIVSLKKDCSSLQSPTKLLDEQDASSKAQISKPNTSIISSSTSTTSTINRLSCCSSQYKKATRIPVVPENTKKDNTCITSTSHAELQYISKILKCSGVERDTPISFTRWFSPTHPLDPSIYHNLEATHYVTITNLDHSLSSHKNPNLSINRKLLFHLVDEILSQILNPYIKFKPWSSFGFSRQTHHHNQQINGFQLVKTLCTTIKSFPRANCQTLQDIDALVEKDFPRFDAASTDQVALEEESEAIVEEIEQDIMESLVQEMALLCLNSPMQR